MDIYSFYTGNLFNAYEWLGCHAGDEYTVFRTFAPSAKKVAIVGDFNNWNENCMKKICDGNFWEIKIKNVKEGMRYKYRIYRNDGTYIDHCDPYGFGMELRPQTASIVRDLNRYEFHDNVWMKKRTDNKDRPLNIYELHLGSWKSNISDKNVWYRYDVLADKLVTYLTEWGYNCIEIMPINEHPSDNSWGYQSTGFYSPTSRYGTLDALKKMIDILHQNDISVILDLVPVHFAVDDYALADYDGTPLYEYPHNDVGYSEWGSKNFNYSRGEVRSFMQSNVNYWLKEYHIDGIRIDALSNIIYWQGNIKRGINQNSLNFIKNMNKGLKEMHQSVMLIAEDSTSFPNVTKSVIENGLGFDYKWDMGWMNDTLEYFKCNTKEREKRYHQLTFSMSYYNNENYLLPLSHDEVVHGKATIVQKMNGEYEDKFPQARALYMYMYAHPGKKLNFMGNEFAQLREWDEKREQDWGILKYPLHDSFHIFIKDLNNIYLNNPCLYAWDYKYEGFKWLDCHQEDKCIYSFLRTDGKETIIAVFNFSNMNQLCYKLNIGENKKIKMIIASDASKYSGNIDYDDEVVVAENNICDIAINKFSAKFYKMLEN